MYMCSCLIILFKKSIKECNFIIPNYCLCVFLVFCIGLKSLYGLNLICLKLNLSKLCSEYSVIQEWSVKLQT